MKREIFLPVVIVALLLAGAGALAQSGEDEPFAPDIVEQGTAASSGYRLTSLSWQVESGASGGAYRLLGPTSSNASPPPSAQVGCCCTYMPCTLRNHP
jgi:hypothetical protein